MTFAPVKWFVTYTSEVGMTKDSAGSKHMLDVQDLNVYYGRVHVLQDVSFAMGAEPLGVLGRNGMGKSTLVKALMGFIPTHSGHALFDGKEILRPSWITLPKSSVHS